MSKDLKGNGHHLTLPDRIYIEQELLQNSSFRSIAATLHKDPSTISKEVKLHRHVPLMHEIKYPHCSSCNKYQSCMVSDAVLHPDDNYYRKTKWMPPVQYRLASMCSA